MDQLNHKPPTIFRGVDRFLTYTSLVFGGLALVFMTGLSVWNVLIMRKALSTPIVGAEDLLILSLVLLVAFSIPLGARTGGHIEIEVLEPKMSPNFAKWSLILIKVVNVAMLITLSRGLFHAGQSAERFGETTQQLLISFEYFYYALSVATAVYALVVVLDIYQLLHSRPLYQLNTKGEGK